MNNTSATVAAAKTAAAYPKTAPFHPHVAYPEYRGTVGGETNHAYDAVRQAFHLLGMDAQRYGSQDWNPLGAVVKPGDRVVIKPNLLAQSHAQRPDEWLQVITHGSVVRAVLDYVALALQGRGEITVMDGPQYDSNWEQIMERTRLREVVQYCSSTAGVPVQLIDLREARQEVRDNVICERISLPSDPRGGAEFNLAGQSAFVGHAGKGKYYGSDYDQSETNRHHSEGRHEYRVSRTAVSADVFINVPKLKTHKKVGVTLCMKNLVGINMGRNWLPHHTDGDPSAGGDQFPQASLKSSMERGFVRWIQRQSLRLPAMSYLYRLAKRIGNHIFGRTDQVVRHGNWHGNDTCWRMVHDINRCLMYGGAETFPSSSAKRFFAVVDGIIGGDGDGPACPSAHPAGLVLAGFNPVAVDCAGARLMGFDPTRIAQLSNSFVPHPLPLADFSYRDIRLVSNRAEWNGELPEIAGEATFHFKPHFGWTGAIEFRKSGASGPSSNAPRATGSTMMPHAPSETA